MSSCHSNGSLQAAQPAQTRCFHLSRVALPRQNRRVVQIVEISHRKSCAKLRLAKQKLCKAGRSAANFAITCNCMCDGSCKKMSGPLTDATALSIQEKHPTGTAAGGVISVYHEYCSCCVSQAAGANLLPVIGRAHAYCRCAERSCEQL